MSKITHIERVRQSNATLQMEVQNILGWDDMQYAEFQQIKGIEYLAHAFGNMPLVDKIPEQKEYWSWWRLHWARRDCVFMSMLNMLFPNEYETYYLEMHTASSMIFKPHGIILKRTYHSMIHNLVKQSTR